jgi:amino acid adenylation domain-containing protein
MTKGYVDDPKKTKQVFLPHPFIKGERIYKTGDLAKMRPDGNIEILGRIDHQIKIRGYRIEPGEIEANLRKQKNIKDAVVIARENKKDNDKYLVAYYILEKKNKKETTKQINKEKEEIKSKLRKALPDYMIPSYFIHLDKFPLNQNGKLDRLNLPKPKEKDLDKNKYIAPKTEIEKKIAKIWQEVLKVKKISRNDNFFNIGGYSLRAIQVLSRINSQFKIDLRLKKIFTSSTIYEISEDIEKEVKKKNKAPQIVIPKTKKKKHYKLSHSQRRMFVLCKLEPNSSFYNVNSIRDIKGDFKITEFKQAINKLIERHEAFRTNFKEINGEPAQVIKKKLELKINNYELKENKNQEEQIDKIIKKYTLSPFKLESDPLIRVAVIKIKEGSDNKKNNKQNKHILIISIHHIIFDGWSMNVFYRELIKTYSAFTENRKADLPKLSIQYKDYAEWEQSKENQKRLKKQEKYWLKRLSNNPPILDLPFDHPFSSVDSYGHKGGVVFDFIESDIVKSIKNISRKNNISYFVFIFTCFNIFISRITNQKDIIIGSVGTNRIYKDLENIIGFFGNNLPIRTKIKDNYNFSDFLQIVKKNIVNDFNQSQYPFEKMINNFDSSREVRKIPLFNVLLQVYEYEKKDVEFSSKGLSTKYKIKNQGIEDDHTKNNWGIYFYFLNKNIKIASEYNSDLFKKETIKNWLFYFKCLIENVLKNPNQKIKNYEIISPKKIRKSALNFENKLYYPQNKSLNQLFEAQACKCPQKTAIDFEGKKISYEELNKKANQLACYLKEQGVKEREVVSINIEPSINLVVCVLAIYKINAVCCILDKDSPRERLEVMLKSNKTKIILSDKNENIDFLKAFKIVNINIEKIKESNNQYKNKKYFKNIAKPQDIAFVCYTSGSTGKPKGVLITHQSIINEVYGKRKNIGSNSLNNLSLSLPLAFLPAINYLHMSLIFGLKLFIYQKQTIKNIVEIFQKIDRDKINLLETTPSAIRCYLDFIEEDPSRRKIEFKNLKELWSVGEKISPELVNRFYSNYNSIPIRIIFGSSETNTSLSTVVSKKLKINRIIEGRPYWNQQSYILDKNQKRLPNNSIGELYISGDGLARGYINDKQKTKEVFLPHPFIKDTRIYKTGDLAKMYPDGNIEILGRVDHQIKIRGMRIEPGEIEANLRKHNNIKDVVVTAKEIKEKDKKQEEKNNKQKQQETVSDKYLIAYYISNNKKKISSNKLKEKLKQNLPDYMIPNYFVYLEKFPLNQNGKLDRLNLPEPKEKDLEKNKYTSPKTEIEKKVAKIWQEVLNVKKISRNDNFFNLGGHSLKAIQVLSRINSQFKIDLGLKDVFESPTIFEIVNRIKKRKKKKFFEIKGGIPMTEIDEWFMNNKKFNHKMPILIKVEDINVLFLKKTVREISKTTKTKIKYLFYNKKTKKWLRKNIDSSLNVRVDNIDKKEYLNKIIKEISLIRSVALEFLLLKNNNDYYFLFNFNKNKITFNDFRSILIKIQYLYNLFLVGMEKNFSYFDESQKIYTPKIKTRNFYNCLHSGILSLLKYFKKDLFFYKSLFPALDLTSLPNLYCVNNNIIYSDFNNSSVAGYGDVYKKLGIVINKKYLKNKKEAENYYKKNALKQKPMLLLGSVKELFFAKKYNVSENVVLINLSIFLPRLNNNPIVYSSDYSYFGEILMKDFWKFWEINDEKYFKKNKENKFFTIEVSRSSKIVSHDYQMLLKALYVNVNEYFRGKIIYKKDNKIKADIFLGKSAYKKFKEIIVNNITNNNYSPDIVLLDLTKRLSRPILILRDLLKDLDCKKNTFKEDIVLVDDIIFLWNDIFYFLSKKSKSKKIKFETSVIALPHPSFYKYKFLNKKDKELLIDTLNLVIKKHDSLMVNLRNKMLGLNIE